MGPSSSLSGATGTLRNLGNKLTSLALNGSENMLVALTDTMQLVCYSFKGKLICINKLLSLFFI